MLNPKTMSGKVFEIRCEKLPCIKGDVIIPIIPFIFRGSTPSL